MYVGTPYLSFQHLEAAAGEHTFKVHLTYKAISKTLDFWTHCSLTTMAGCLEAAQHGSTVWYNQPGHQREMRKSWGTSFLFNGTLSVLVRFNCLLIQSGIPWDKSLNEEWDQVVCGQGIVLIVNWWKKIQPVVGSTVPWAGLWAA